MIAIHLDSFGITPVDTLVVAVSGGADSMCLLSLLARTHPIDRLVVGHFDHSLRGEESTEDAKFVAMQCHHMGIRAVVEIGNVAEFVRIRRCGIEEGARILRYDFLERLRISAKGTYILTAHTGSDRIETMLLHITRGTKLPGLSVPRSVNGFILRPLLGASRSDVIAYMTEHAIPWREDSSNANTSYLRNRLRHEVVPSLRTINPDIERTFGNLAEYAGALQAYIDTQVENFLDGRESFRVEAFIRLPEILRGECLRYLYARFHDGSTIGLSEGNMNEMLRYVYTARDATYKDVGRLRLTKSRSIVTASRIL